MTGLTDRLTAAFSGRYRIDRELDRGGMASVYDLSPGGRHFLVARAVGQARSQLVVWTNWLDRLKAQLANTEGHSPG